MTLSKLKIVLDFKECLCIQDLHIGSWITGLSKVLSVELLESCGDGIYPCWQLHCGDSLYDMRVWEEGSAGNLPFVYACLCLCLFMILKHKWSISADVPLTVTASHITSVITCDSGKVVDITCQSEQHNPNQLIICWIAVARLALYAVFLFVYLLLDILLYDKPTECVSAR